MIFLLASLVTSLPAEPPWQEHGPDYTDINRMAQESTKRDYPWWWRKYGCSGTQWVGEGPCTDLTE